MREPSWGAPYKNYHDAVFDLIANPLDELLLCGVFHRKQQAFFFRSVHQCFASGSLRAVLKAWRGVARQAQARKAQALMQGSGSWSSSTWFYKPGEWVMALSTQGGWWHARVERHLERDRVLVRWHMPRHPDWHNLLDKVAEWRVCRDPKFFGRDIKEWVESRWDFPLLRLVSLKTLDSFCVKANSSGHWALDALRLFQRNGFVVVRDAFSLERCEKVLEACRQEEVALRSHNAARPGHHPAGRRGPGRWSFGVASKTRSMLHVPAWAHLLDCAPLLEVLELVMPNGGTCTSSGGDFVEAHVGFSYQPLHSDLAGCDLGPFNVSFPPPCVSANFVVHPVTERNGPMRILPGTQRHSVSAKVTQQFWDTHNGDEPREWRDSVLQPLSAGDIIRDVRVLHGGTPNLSDATRFLPAVEFVFGSYKDSSFYIWDEIQHLPKEIFSTLSNHAKSWCGGVVAPKVDAGWI